VLNVIIGHFIFWRGGSPLVYAVTFIESLLTQHRFTIYRWWNSVVLRRFQEKVTIKKKFTFLEVC
jgi:hypothetical protein